METNIVRLYTFKADWVDTFSEPERDMTSHGVVCAGSYAEAVEKITKRLPYAANIYVNEYEDTDFIFMSKKLWKQLKDTEYGLEDEPVEEDEDVNW